MYMCPNTTEEPEAFLQEIPLVGLTVIDSDDQFKDGRSLAPIFFSVLETYTPK